MTDDSTAAMREDYYILATSSRRDERTRVIKHGDSFGVFDQYGDIEFEDEKARLDNFAIQIANEPLATGQIIMFAGRETFKNEAAERLARAKSYIVDVREIDRNRIITTDCGFSEELRITLLVVPLEASALTCDTYSAIPFSEVKFTKPHPKSPKKRL